MYQPHVSAAQGIITPLWMDLLPLVPAPGAISLDYVYQLHQGNLNTVSFHGHQRLGPEPGLGDNVGRAFICLVLCGGWLRKDGAHFDILSQECNYRRKAQGRHCLFARHGCNIG